MPFGDCPLDEDKVGEEVYMDILNRATRYVHIMTPYLILDGELQNALECAARRGVDVRIILPFRSDSKIVYWASRSYIGEMLDAGIKVYFFCKGFNHSKILIIDDNFCSVGSANMDIRSFEDNFEVSAIMYDPKVAEELTGYFLGDIGNSVAVTPESWENRPNLHAVYESLARLASPLL